MVDILYVVRASPVKRSKGVQISLFTPNLSWQKRIIVVSFYRKRFIEFASQSFFV